MKLEDIFIKAFFYPFLICIILSSIIVTIILGLFTNNNINKRTGENIINLEKKYSKMIINHVNAFITTKFLLFQASLNELIISYQNIARKVLESNEPQELNTEYLKCLLNVDYDCDEDLDEVSYQAFWLLDEKTDETNLEDKKEVKQQLIAYSHIIPNVNSALEATLPNIYTYYFLFDDTELFISYPLSDACIYDFVHLFRNPDYEIEPAQCLNENGEYQKVYKFKCQTIYKNMMKSKTSIFDNNYLSNQNKSIFISNYHDSVDYEFDYDQLREFSMCVAFDDPITKGKAYSCMEGSYTDMILPLENFNMQIFGYYFISNVGFNNIFFFPLGSGVPKTSTDEIYKWGNKYKLNEKIFFHNKIRKIMSSNYIDHIGHSVYDEVYVNGKNSSEQYFSVNGVEYNFSIFPIIFENLDGKKEHIFSLIYIYNSQLYLEEIDKYSSSIIIKIILELLLFIIFGYGLLYIIYLTFNTLAKHIVIPIKNVIYMLKGINIGGENRLKFLDFLSKKQEENLEKLENAYLFEDKDAKNQKEIIEQINDDLEDNNENKFIENDNFINIENIKTKDSNINTIIKKLYSDINNKYDEESNYIEKELSFYDFDDQLLQYRPLEIEQLMKSLIDLKSALLFTSADREVKQIINYSYSEKIFGNFKNKEGAIICQSNIGNLQSQLFKFDKAIYHLAVSLQDNNLKKFLNQNLRNEFDEDDSLLNKISNLFSKRKKKDKKKDKNNKLVERQMNGFKNNFSQKLIGILINIRYCRLIHFYYLFFKNIQKLQKLKCKTINDQFMNTKFHTIDYYNKILIQFICLSYKKNDLIKIGESILDYIEFLIKFKLKISSKNDNYLSIKDRNKPEFKKIKIFKKKIFDKIMNWFNVFDDYISYVKDNSSLGDSKCIIDDYSHSLNDESYEFNLESQTAFQFRINIQKSNFLKGKFCLYCKNYIDALYYFIRSSKNESIVTDGLIKKRSLKHIYKILIKMNKKYEKLGLKNLNIYKKLKEYKRDKNKTYNSKYRIGRKRTIRMDDSQNVNITTFGDELKTIKNDISNNINECYAKREKNIIILIDFNIYNKKKLNSKTSKIDSFIEEAITILKNYLSSNDKLGILIYYNDYKIICPLMPVNKIDIKNCSTDLYYCKNREISTKENNIDSIESKYNEIEILHLDGNNNSEHLAEESLELSENEEINYDKINGLVKAINYLNNYSIIKEGIKVDKYIILFTDILNAKFFEDEEVEKIFGKIIDDKYSIFLLVGKNKKSEKNNINDINNYIGELILGKFGEKSEAINFENMKKIKTILSNNKVIKDEIFYPNEIYK